jgi:hypothetical protein
MCHSFPLLHFVAHSSRRDDQQMVANASNMVCLVERGRKVEGGWTSRSKEWWDLTFLIGTLLLSFPKTWLRDNSYILGNNEVISSLLI